jgi:hypothetical protein
MSTSLQLVQMWSLISERTPYLLLGRFCGLDASFDSRAREYLLQFLFLLCKDTEAGEKWRIKDVQLDVHDWLHAYVVREKRNLRVDCKWRLSVT